MAAGRVVSAGALVDGVWGEEWSPGRERNLHALVYQLRRRLAGLEPEKGGARLARAGAGYRLALGRGELDAAVFRDLAGRGREAARAGDIAAARELFGQALGLWRGAALADAAPLCARLAGEAARLEDARLAAVEERIGCDLALGLGRRGGRGAGRAGERVPAARAAGGPADDRAVPERAAGGGASRLRPYTAAASRAAGPGPRAGAGRAAGPGARRSPGAGRPSRVRPGGAGRCGAHHGCYGGGDGAAAAAGRGQVFRRPRGGAEGAGRPAGPGRARRRGGREAGRAGRAGRW